MSPVSACPWSEHQGPGKDLCLLKTLEDGEELVYCDHRTDEPETEGSTLGPFMVCFDLSEGYKPVAQVSLMRGGKHKFLKELRGEEALELHRTLAFDR